MLTCIYERKFINWNILFCKRISRTDIQTEMMKEFHILIAITNKVRSNKMIAM